MHHELCRLKHTKFANGFEVAELQRSQVPDAPQAKPGKRVSVKYEGKLQSNGKVFDKTKGNKTFSFRLGECRVLFQLYQTLTQESSVCFICS
jgi:FKBP-type peptidyl-prolyl cis-trans isomerase